MASPFTVVKGDECTRLTPAGIIRCLQVQDLLVQSTGGQHGQTPLAQTTPHGTARQCCTCAHAVPFVRSAGLPTRPLAHRW